MNISIYPTRFSLLAGMALLCLAACTTTRPPAPINTPERPPANQASTQPPAETRSAAQEDAPPSVLIRGKSARLILDAVVKYRTSKGMKLVSRDAGRAEFSILRAKATPPDELRMIYSISPASGALRLSAQVFQVVPRAGKKQTNDITDGVRDKLDEELATYVR